MNLPIVQDLHTVSPLQIEPCGLRPIGVGY